MKLSEFLVDFPVFTKLSEKLYQYPAIDKPEMMDALLVLEHGQKTVFEGVREMDKTVLVNLLIAKFSDRWDAQVERAALMAGNVNNRTEKSENTTRIEDKVSANTSTDKVSAFNSDSLVDNGGNTSSGTDGLTGETVKTIVNEQIDVRKAYNMLNVSAKDTIMSTVVSDVGSFLTLSIY